ncbi:hypothetical protein BDB01DRAFT_788367 [Pilobolus umbonatus]|nr:hypothetical protein BDB01DRAFT_788367 [Pilobolus umbonatus]
MNPINEHSFILKNKISKVRKRRMKPLPRLRRHKDTVPPPEIDMSECLPPVLDHAVICIDANVPNKDRLCVMAKALGAEIADKIVPFKVTHLVHSRREGSHHPKQVLTALKHHIRPVSPLWIMECYKNKRYEKVELYPYDIDMDIMMGISPEDDDDDNPFGLSESELNVKPLTVYEQIKATAVVEMDVPTEVELTEEERRIMAEKRAEQIRSAILATKQKRGPEIKQPEKIKIVSHQEQEIFPHQEKMEIWYGEQPVYSDTNKRPVSAPNLRIPTKSRTKTTTKTIINKPLSNRLSTARLSRTPIKSSISTSKKRE